MTHRYRYIILGAGCAGLSLVWYLLERGVTEPILVLDRKKAFVNDRTWCFWDVEPTPFTTLARHRWDSWTIRTDAGETVSHSPLAPYVALYAEDFYRAVGERITLAPNVELRLGTTIQDAGCTEITSGVRVSTDHGIFEGDFLIDALALSGSRFPVAKERDISFLQVFRGQFVRTNRDVFDPMQTTLMDFTVPQPPQSNCFMYVLPSSPRTALVENTYLLSTDGRSLAKDALVEASDITVNREAIADYLRKRYGLSKRDFQVETEESGIIPMTSRRFPPRVGERIWRIGMGGGATRPSSGYTFLRIQRQCRELAATLAGELSPHRLASPPLDRSKHAILDIIFLEAMRSKPTLVPEYFQRLFRQAPTSSVVRFLTEHDTFYDDLSVLISLPCLDFALAALRSSPLWLSRLGAAS